jgi:hypothetical protein
LVSPPVEQGKDDGFRHSAIQGPVASPHPQPKPSMQTKWKYGTNADAGPQPLSNSGQVAVGTHACMHARIYAAVLRQNEKLSTASSLAS